jgi:tRNA dimethylallyltransferase
MNQATKSAIFLMGPTCCGKTDLALKLAEYLPIEMINVDSAQVYRGMDIGTSKPTAQELAKVPHHLIDICSPLENYSAAEFCQDAVKLMIDIHARGKIPLLVGGTMLYFYALQFGLSELPPANLSIRQNLNQQASQSGWPQLHSKLQDLDPEAAAAIGINDSKRIQRALEVCLVSGNKFSELLSQQKNNLFINDWRVHYFAIQEPDRAVLHRKIADRFQQMLQQGLLAEVNKLLQQGVTLEMPAMRCVGYRQLAKFLQNQDTEQQAYQKAIFATRQLAKRQFTWLRKWNKMVELHVLLSNHQQSDNLGLITRNIKR